MVHFSGKAQRITFNFFLRERSEREKGRLGLYMASNGLYVS
ncbi:MAG: hypothetical protein U5L45_00010 [Saprospiraceae bacterium]|nr:hypothetical protein [Saprospiraceae bacterium]